MLLNETILSAMRKAVAAAGSQSAFARLAGLGKQHVSKYLRGEVRAIEYETWFKIQPLLADYLPPAFTFSAADPGRMLPAQERFLPLLTAEQAAKFDSTLESFPDYAGACASESALDLPGPDGMLGIRLEKKQSTARYPAGTILYLDGCGYPQAGHPAAAVLRNGRGLVIGHFLRNGEESGLRLESGAEFRWKRPGENPFAWIHPVLFALQDER